MQTFFGVLKAIWVDSMMAETHREGLGCEPYFSLSHTTGTPVPVTSHSSICANLGLFYLDKLC